MKESPNEMTMHKTQTQRLGSRLYEITVVLEEIEKELVAGGMAREGLEHFKMAVDHVRLSVWALLTGGQQGDGMSPAETLQVIARYRMNRAGGMCRRVLTDIENGVIAPNTRELQRFHSMLEEAVERVGQKLRGPT